MSDNTVLLNQRPPERTEGFRPRELMWELLPHWSWLQLLLTAITGVAHEGQILPRRSPWYHLGRAILLLIAGVGLAIYSSLHLSLASLMLIPLGWLCTVSAARNLQVTILHAASHYNFTGIVWIDQLVGRGIATVQLIQSFPEYRESHLRDHHGKGLSTARDGTVKALADAGLVSGLTVPALKFALICALFSPWAHARTLFKRRLRSQFQTGDAMTRATAWIYLAAIGGATAWIGVVPVVVGVVVPLTVLYQQAQLLRLCVEHRWARPGTPRTRETIDALTVPVFLGEAPPENGGRLAWCRWWLRMAGHALARITLLPGDSGPGHDLHHHDAKGDWANHIAARQSINAMRRQRGLPPYGGVWGYLNALDPCFDSFRAGTVAENA